MEHISRLAADLWAYSGIKQGIFMNYPHGFMGQGAAVSCAWPVAGGSWGEWWGGRAGIIGVAVLQARGNAAWCLSQCTEQATKRDRVNEGQTFSIIDTSEQRFSRMATFLHKYMKL